MPSKVTIPTGTRFGRLVVLGEDFERPQPGPVRWICRCDCGVTKSVLSSSLLRDGTISCGCLQRERAAAITGAGNTRHGLADKIPEYGIWNSMLRRCRDPKNISYPNYGGRGVGVCERWRRFESFYADMGSRLTPHHSIERIDNDGDYEPGNCRWALPVEQGRNRRTNITLTHNGETLTLAGWSDKTGIGRTTLQWRYHRGWFVDRILEGPVRGHSGKSCHVNQKAT